MHNVATAQSTVEQSSRVVARGRERRLEYARRAQRVEYGAAAAQISTARVQYSTLHEYIDIHVGLAPARLAAHAAPIMTVTNALLENHLLIINYHYLRLYSILSRGDKTVTG